MAHDENKRIATLREKFFEGTSTLAEERELASLIGNTEATIQNRAEAAMFALFEEDQKVRCQGFILPIRKHKSHNNLLFAISAAVTAVLVTLSVTVWMPSQPAVFCIVNGIPVTDPDALTENKQMAIDVLLSALDNTVSIINPLEEVGRAMNELENLGLFNTVYLDVVPDSDNS